MHLRRVIVIVMLLVSISLLLVAIFYGSSLQLVRGGSTASLSAQEPLPPPSKVIQLENAHQGTTSWQIPPPDEAGTEIQAYVNATSVQAGQKLSFYVSTQTEGMRYSIDIFRLGWYQGLGGRLMLSLKGLTGHAQGYYDNDTDKLVDCPSCLFNKTTGLVEANWLPSYTLTVPSDWTTGIYLAKFTDAQNKQTYAPFDVRGNFHSRYLAVTPDATYEAYNIWGGFSLYDKGNSSLEENTLLPRAVDVSFDRPYIEWTGSSQVLVFEADAIHWMERQGYDLSYASDIDLQADPGQVLNHRAYISLGHDEYWSKEMRDAVENARDNGVGLAFLGANDVYWQIRLEPDSAGVPNRTVVCYKVQTLQKNLSDDPLYRKDNSRVTAQWSDPVIGRPENALIGIMYTDSSWDKFNVNFPSWHVSATANSALLSKFGLEPGQQYGCDLVGYEWDHIIANGATPVGLQVLSTTNVYSNVTHTATPSNTTYYIALSGAMVFATGSIYWTFGLDNYRLFTDQQCAGQERVVPGMQKLMAYVMEALVMRHPIAQPISGAVTPGIDTLAF